MDAVRQRFYQYIYVVAAPIADIRKLAAIFLVGFTIIDMLPGNGVWIKIIIHVDAVYIVVLHYIQYHLYNVFAHFGQAGVKQLDAPVGKKPLRMNFGNMLRT